MGYIDQDGNWIEDIRSRSYKSEKEAQDKINAVYQFYVVESGWVLNGEPRVEKIGNEYVAVIPLKKPAELNNGYNR